MTTPRCVADPLRAALVACALLAAAGLHAQGTWSEPGFGVTLDAPAGATAQSPPPPGASAGWTFPDGSLLRLRLLDSDAPIGGLKEVQAMGWAGFTIGVPTSSWLRERAVAERPGLVQVVELEEAPSKFLPPSVGHQRVTYGQVMMKLDPYHIALLELFVEGEEAEAVKPRVLALADALGVAKPPELMRERRAAVERGAAFLAGLDRAAALAALPGTLAYEVGPPPGVDGVRGEAVRRVLTDPAEVAAEEVAFAGPGPFCGWRVVMEGGGVRMALLDEAWVAEDGGAEAWSGRRFQGEAAPAASGGGGLPRAGGGGVSAAYRTGVRNGPAIDLNVSDPPAGGGNRRAGVESKSWTLPERLPPNLIDGTDVSVAPLDAYLNRLDVMLLPELLPREPAADYVFYAVDPESDTLSLRFYRVEPRGGGGADVTERPTPSAPPVLHRIDAQGVRTLIVQPTGLEFRLKPGG